MRTALDHLARYLELRLPRVVVLLDATAERVERRAAQGVLGDVRPPQRQPQALRAAQALVTPARNRSISWSMLNEAGA